MISLFCICDLFFFSFFFQVEDGIRDLTVTGVQTCALPISMSVRMRVELQLAVRQAGQALEHAAAVAAYAQAFVDLIHRQGPGDHDDAVGLVPVAGRAQPPARAQRPGMDARGRAMRSEERRVGKEGRSRW